MNDSLSLRNRLNTTVRDIPRSGIRDFFDLVTTMKDVISLGIGEPDFDTPWHVRESTVFALERGATHYSSNFGYLDLRRALARYVAKTFGAEYNPENEVLITVGVSEALDLALRALLNPGDEVIYHEPCYVSYRATILLAHGVPVEVETRAENGFRLTRAMLEAKVTPRTKVLMLNFPNNPTGAVAPLSFYEHLSELAERYDFAIASDEAYSELWFDEPPPSALQVRDRSRVIVFQTLSKRSSMTGYRSGFVAGDPLLIAALKQLRPSIGVAPQTFVQRASIAAWGDEGHVVETRARYRAKRDLLLPAVRAAGLEPAGGDATFFLWCRTPGGEDAEACAERLLARGLVVAPGTFFGAGGEGHVRIALVPTLAECERAAQAFATLG